MAVGGVDSVFRRVPVISRTNVVRIRASVANTDWAKLACRSALKPRLALATGDFL